MITLVHSARHRGSAVLVVLVLVMIMGTLSIANTRVLSHLRRELQLIDQKQQERLSPPSPGAKPVRDPAGRNDGRP